MSADERARLVAATLEGRVRQLPDGRWRVKNVQPLLDAVATTPAAVVELLEHPEQVTTGLRVECAFVTNRDSIRLVGRGDIVEMHYYDLRGQDVTADHPDLALALTQWESTWD